jgi:large subunit ribosomal protein L15
VKLHHLYPAEGAKTDRTRVGRGRAGRRGKTAGRGTKGTGARKNVPAYFEGGQMPYQRRVPKLKGFTNPNRVEYAPVNVEVLATYFDGEVSPAELYAHGLAHKGSPVKILGRGEIDKALTVRAHAFSATAKAKIEAAGGTAETIARGRSGATAER